MNPTPTKLALAVSLMGVGLATPARAHATVEPWQAPGCSALFGLAAHREQPYGGVRFGSECYWFDDVPATTTAYLDRPPALPWRLMPARRDLRINVERHAPRAVATMHFGGGRLRAAPAASESQHQAPAPTRTPDISSLLEQSQAGTHAADIVLLDSAQQAAHADARAESGAPDSAQEQAQEKGVTQHPDRVMAALSAVLRADWADPGAALDDWPARQVSLAPAVAASPEDGVELRVLAQTAAGPVAAVEAIPTVGTVSIVALVATAADTAAPQASLAEPSVALDRAGQPKGSEMQRSVEATVAAAAAAAAAHKDRVMQALASVLMADNEGSAADAMQALRTAELRDAAPARRAATVVRATIAKPEQPHVEGASSIAVERPDESTAAVVAGPAHPPGVHESAPQRGSRLVDALRAEDIVVGSHGDQVLMSLSAISKVGEAGHVGARTHKRVVATQADKVLMSLETLRALDRASTATREAPREAYEPPARQARGTVGEGWTTLAAQQLDGVRGGFITDSGLKISFGIERAVYINGALTATTSLNVADLGQVSGGRGTSISGIDSGSLTLIQTGPGNTFAPGQVSAAGLQTVIQNTLDNQKIETVTIINATANSMAILRSQNLQSSMRSAITDSLRR